MECMDDAVLVLIDVQRGFSGPAWGPRNNPEAEATARRLLAAWRDADRPVVCVQHDSTEPDSPLRPGLPGNDLQPGFEPRDGEKHVRKSVNSAFVGTDLAEWLRERGYRTLVLAGLTTNHCVSTTARMAENLGFEPWVVADATAAFEATGPDGTTYPAEVVHAVALASLRDEFARIVYAEDVLDETSTPR